MHVQNVRKQGAAELQTGVMKVDLSAAFDLASKSMLCNCSASQHIEMAVSHSNTAESTKPPGFVCGLGHTQLACMFAKLLSKRSAPLNLWFDLGRCKICCVFCMLHSL